MDATYRAVTWTRCWRAWKQRRSKNDDFVRLLKLFLTARVGQGTISRAPDNVPFVLPSQYPGSRSSADSEVVMPKVKANNITLHYEQQGSGDPLVLIPYLAADN